MYLHTWKNIPFQDSETWINSYIQLIIIALNTD